MRTRLLIEALAIVLAGLGVVSAYTIATGFITFRQPNGVEFIGRQWSEGWLVYTRTEDGYEFVQTADGWSYYAKLNECGDFVPSEFRVGIDDPVVSGVLRELERPPERRAQIEAALEASRTGAPYELEECPIGGIIPTVASIVSWARIKAASIY